jgi:amino acid transporter
MALVTALVATIGYNFFVAGAVGTSGFFMSTVINQLTGLDLPWPLWSLVSVIAALILTRQGIDFSAKILGVALVCEVSILLIFDFAVLFRTGFTVAAFHPTMIFGPGLGLGLLFASNAFIGVEATGLFSEEAKNPRRTIPRATFLAIGFIGAFTAFTTWAIVSATGAEQAQKESLKHLAAGDLVFALSERYLGHPLTVIMMILLLISLFAALMALHNSATRYLHRLGTVRILPHWLARTRSNGVPQRASIVQFVFACLVAGGFAVAGLDPISTLVPTMTGFGTLGILVLQLLACLAVVVHFRRRRDSRLVSTLVAPGLGLIGLVVIVGLALLNFPTMAGSDSVVIAQLPWLLAVALVGGLAYAAYLRSKRPEVYAGLEHDLDRFDLATSAMPVAPMPDDELPDAAAGPRA